MTKQQHNKALAGYRAYLVSWSDAAFFIDQHPEQWHIKDYITNDDINNLRIDLETDNI